VSALMGRLSDQPLAVVLAQVLSGARSGVLNLSKGAMTRQIFIENGKVIRYAASNLLTESLSEHLKRQGRFRPEQMRKATTSKQPNELLSSALLRLGFITPEEQQALVREMIERVVVSAAAWADAAYEYREGELPFTQPGDAGLPVPVAILGLVRHASEPAFFRTVLGQTDLKVNLSPTPPMPLESVPLDPTEGYLVSRADGTLSVREICAMSPLGHNETERALCGLILSGILAVGGAGAAAGRPEPPPKPADSRAAAEVERPRVAADRKPASSPAPRRRAAGPVEEVLDRFAALRGQNLYQVLGVTPTAPESEIRHAYYSLAKRLHPDKFSDDETKFRAEKLFSAITEAYATLSRPPNRQEYDGTVTRQAGEKVAAEIATSSAGAELARQNFLRGKALLENGDIVKALPFFEHAVEQDESKETYRRYLATVQSRNPRLRKEAESNFLKAIDLNPTSAENYAQLGLLYRKMGHAAKGDEYLQKALSWDATNETAREAFGDDQRKGIFKGLFRK